jgi:hypothetical protein
MDPGIELAAAAALGFVVQWARAYKAVNNWLVWAGVGIATAALWIWATPAAALLFHDNWRNAIFSIVTFALSAKGAGTMMNDAKVAPAQDSK